MKKIFLLTVLLFGITFFSYSQSSVSSNVVGYVQLSLNQGWSMIANPFLIDGNSSNNTVVAVLGTNFPVETTVYSFNNGAYAAPITYFGPSIGWLGNTNDIANSLIPGRGIFVKIPEATTIIFYGDVPQGNLSIPYIAGFNIISSPTAQGGKIETDLEYSPITGDLFYQFVSGGGYKAAQSYFGPIYGWLGFEPDIAIGEAFFLQAKTNGVWTRNFIIP